MYKRKVIINFFSFNEKKLNATIATQAFFILAICYFDLSLPPTSKVYFSSTKKSPCFGIVIFHTAFKCDKKNVSRKLPLSTCCSAKANNKFVFFK
ncbi:MAG: hypothetical protein ACOYKE_05070 [Ferruginibacter sp.]